MNLPLAKQYPQGYLDPIDVMPRSIFLSGASQWKPLTFTPESLRRETTPLMKRMGGYVCPDFVSHT